MKGHIRERLPGHWAIVIDLRSRDWRPDRRHSLLDKIGRFVPATRELSLALLMERTWPPDHSLRRSNMSGFGAKAEVADARSNRRK
jgi:hypothetical protein